MKKTIRPDKKHMKKKISPGLLLIFLVIAALVGVAIYMISTKSKEKEKSRTDHSKPWEPPFVNEGTLAFLDAASLDTLKVVEIEIADTEKKRNQGLMWRRSMPENAAMLFIFEREQPLSFWMKNTYISLDIMYVNQAMEIVSISEFTIPHSDASLPSRAPAKYVVEVNAGFSSKFGIKPGDRIEFKRR
jgi:uncharacterized membrane protein (UPF0127 family)